MANLSIERTVAVGRGIKLFHFGVIAAASSALLFIVAIAFTPGGPEAPLYGERVEGQLLLWLTLQLAILVFSGLLAAPVTRFVASLGLRSRVAAMICELVGSAALVFGAVWRWSVSSS